MLKTLRKNSKKIFTAFIVVGVAAVMGLYGIGGDPSGSGGGGDGAAAWVNGDMITRRDFQMELENKVAQFQGLFGAQYDEKFLVELQIPQRTLDELIQFKLLAQQAKQMNLLVPDTELADYIRALPYYQRNGKFDAEAYKKIPNVGMQERRQRERLQWAKLQSYLTDRIRVTPDLLRRSYDLKETKADVSYAKFTAEELGKGRSATAAEVAEFEKAAPAETFQQYYDSHRDEFTTKAAVQLRQIRVGIPYKASDAQKNEAKAKIDAIAKTVTAANFAATAKAKSDDEFAKKGGSLGWIDRGTLEPPLETAIESLPENTVSAPVETSFGYFLLLVEAKRPQTVQPLEKAKATIAKRLAGEKLQRDYADGLRKQWEERLAAGQPLEAELAKHKIALKKTGPFSVGQGYLPNIGQSDALLDALFALSTKDPVHKRLLYHQGAYYYLKLASLETPKGDDFAKNAEVVQKSVETALQSELMTQWVAALRKQSTIRTDIQLPSSANAE